MTMSYLNTLKRAMLTMEWLTQQARASADTIGPDQPGFAEADLAVDRIAHVRDLIAAALRITGELNAVKCELTGATAALASIIPGFLETAAPQASAVKGDSE